MEVYPSFVEKKHVISRHWDWLTGELFQLSEVVWLVDS